MALFYIRPCDAGTICGVNQWKHISDIIDIYLKQSKKYKTVIQQFKEKSNINSVINNIKGTIPTNIDNISVINFIDENINWNNNDIIQVIPHMTENRIKEIIEDNLIETVVKLPTITATTIDSIIEKKEQLSHLQSDKFKVVLSSHINMSYGCYNEKTILQMYEKINNTILNSPSGVRTYYVDNIKFRGICDGIDKTNKKIIEAKCRVNRLFEYIPLYEIYQCYCYMKMYKYNLCDLIQYRNELYSIEKIELDDVVWKTIIFPKMVNFINFLEMIISSDELIISFYKLTVPDRKLMIDSILK